MDAFILAEIYGKPVRIRPQEILHKPDISKNFHRSFRILPIFSGAFCILPDDVAFFVLTGVLIRDHSFRLYFGISSAFRNSLFLRLRFHPFVFPDQFCIFQTRIRFFHEFL